MADATVADEAVAVLFRQRRDGLEAAVRTARTKSAMTVAVAHLDELNLLHDALAGLGLLAPREVDPLAFAPYDPTAHLSPEARS